MSSDSINPKKNKSDDSNNNIKINSKRRKTEKSLIKNNHFDQSDHEDGQIRKNDSDSSDYDSSDYDSSDYEHSDCHSTPIINPHKIVFVPQFGQFNQFSQFEPYGQFNQLGFIQPQQLQIQPLQPQPQPQPLQPLQPQPLQPQPLQPQPQPQPQQQQPEPLSEIDILFARVYSSNLEESVKKMVITRILNMQNDKPKQLEWIDSLLSIPFGKYSFLPIKYDDPKEKIVIFFNDVIKKLDETVYGMQPIKEEIINYLAQCITAGGQSTPRVLALQGSAGVGKSHLIKVGLSEALQRPMRCINMGGVKDSSYISGFDYTYAGSRYGVIVQTLITQGVMDSIIFFDELDKISTTNEGIDIQYMLMNITDPVHNKTFQDKYFSGINIDLSRTIFIFAFNDTELVLPILRDRLHIVNVPDPSLEDKVIIAKKHLLTELCKNIGFDQSAISITDETMKYLINNYCKDDRGVRPLKRCIETILLKLNIIRLVGCNISNPNKLKNITFPLVITEKIIDTILCKQIDNSNNVNHMSMYM